MIFLLSEADGTLPNTADKRYPVFKLEESEAHKFEPLIRFLRYIGSDFTSLVELLRSSLGRAGGLLFRTRRGWLILTLTLGAIAAFSYFDVQLQGASAALKWDRHYPEERAAAVLANTMLFGGLGVFSLFTAEYAAVALASVRRQERAQKRAALEVSAATFLRDDWLGLVPGLENGSAMYQCMFERQALAHHEAG